MRIVFGRKFQNFLPFLHLNTNEYRLKQGINSDIILALQIQAEQKKISEYNYLSLSHSEFIHQIVNNFFSSTPCLINKEYYFCSPNH